ALQRVHTSRSIGFSCRHSSSKSPSQPASLVTRPDHTGNLRSSGSSPLFPVIRTLTASCAESLSAQSSAASAGPTISTSPPDLNSTAGIGSGSGSAAAAMSAAILGVASACVAFPPCIHPACSRTLTKRIGFESASSPNSAASCVQATSSSSAAPSAAWNAAASLRHSWSCTTSGSAAPSAADSALASSPTVWLQLQTLSVLLARLILLRLPLWLLVLGLLLLLREEHGAHLVERGEELGRDRLGAGPVARERLEQVGQLEVRVGEHLLQRDAAQRVVDLRMHEVAEVGLGGERLHRRQRRRGQRVERLLLLERRLFFRRLRGRFALHARPAREKGFPVLAHQTR